MPVNISCPHCQKALQLQETLMGKKVRCPGCKEVFTAAPPEEQIQAADEFEEIQERPSRPTPARPRRPAPAPPPDEEDEGADDEDTPSRGKPHRGGLILTLGILGLVFSCCPLAGWILGGIALSMGNTDLRLMAARKMDRAGQGMTKAGKILGIVDIIFGTLAFILHFPRFSYTRTLKNCRKTQSVG